MSYSDDLTLNYFKKSREDNAGEPDSLMKAMNRAGLVQKDVQVRGKNGQTFTRKQWVKAGEEVKQPQDTKKQEDVKEKTTSVSNKSGKQQVAEMLASGKSRTDIMAEFEKQGVTWKKNDHEGINWMRAAMAIQKHLEGSNNSSGESVSAPKAESKPDTASKVREFQSEMPKPSEKLSSKKISNIHGTYMQGDPARDIAYVLLDRNSKMSKIVNRNADLSGKNGSVDKLLEKPDIVKYMDETIKSWKDKVKSDINAHLDNKKDTKAWKERLQFLVDSSSYIESFDQKWQEWKSGQRKENTSTEKASVIGNDYTQLTTEDESGTIEGEAHNMMVGWLKSENGGNKKPTESQIKQAATSLKESALKTVISSYNQDVLVHQLAMAKHFTKLAGGNMDHMTLENIYKDVVSGQGSYTQEQKCNALAKLCGKDYDSTGDYVRKCASNSMASANIVPMSKGYFEVTFFYDDGVSHKERFDSVKSAKEAADKFIKKEDEYYQKDKDRNKPTKSENNE